MKICKNCGSENLIWHSGVSSRGGVQDGRIKLNEVSAVFFLGCEECSETLKIVTGDYVANKINELGIKL